LQTLRMKSNRIFKNEKGLTLIELLAVIVLLGIIAAIAVPSIGGVIENSKKNADVESISLLKDTAVRYLYDVDPDGNGKDTSNADITGFTFNATTGEGTLLVSALVNSGYLREAPKQQSGSTGRGEPYASIDVEYSTLKGWVATGVNSADPADD